jgi:hypothetical protein
MDDERHALSPRPPNQLATLPPDRRGLWRILWQVVSSVEATPLSRPEVPPDLSQMPPLARLHGCVRLFLLDVEFALSPGGQLRGLAKLTCRIAVAMGMLLLMAAGVLALVSLVLGIAVVVAGQLVALLWSLLQAVLLIAALLAIGVGLLLAVRLATRAG